MINKCCLNNEVDLLTLKKKIIFHRCFKWSFLFFLTDTRRVVCKSQFCFLKEFRRKHSSLPPMNTENRIKAIRSCFENWTMRCILCPMNTVSLSFFRSSQQFQCSRQSASAEPQCGFYKK